MERQKQPEVRGPLHLLRCAGELGLIAVDQALRAVNQSIEAAWPDDDPEDQAIQSERF